ncbi:TfuA-like protein [Streptomyces sp. NPDC087908]|uniref:TfuA-like protein n=1 Tax=Streptomyces sp. NPDC087908 TaxID=3365820 RepID=UPI00381E95CC
MNPRRIVFMGPTLSPPEEECGITFMPPVAGGDLLSLDVGPGDYVGIVDGYFHQRPAVRHKEVLALLERGVQVHGAASMGALRAAELHSFGMRGHGLIYRCLREDILDGDDEVCISHLTSDHGFRPVTEALVNARYNLALAVRSGECSPELADSLVRVLKSLPYNERNYRSALALTHASADEVDRLTGYLDLHRVDLKAKDASSLIKHFIEVDSATQGRSWSLRRTTHFMRWQREAARRSPLYAQTALAVLDICRLFARDYVDFHRIICADVMRRSGLRAGGPPGEAASAWLGLSPPTRRDWDALLKADRAERDDGSGEEAATALWPKELGPARDWLTTTERLAPPTRQRELVRARMLFWQATPEWIAYLGAALTALPCFPELEGITRAALGGPLSSSVLTDRGQADLLDLLTERWECTRPELERVGRARGFKSTQECLAALTSIGIVSVPSIELRMTGDDCPR